MTASWIVGVALALTAILVDGQASSFGMLRSCPEGCRPIDFETSCGSVDNVLNCTEAHSGDVTIVCLSGASYSLTYLGCDLPANADTAATVIIDDTKRAFQTLKAIFLYLMSGDHTGMAAGIGFIVIALELALVGLLSVNTMVLATAATFFASIGLLAVCFTLPSPANPTLLFAAPALGGGLILGSVCLYLRNMAHLFVRPMSLGMHLSWWGLGAYAHFAAVDLTNTVIPFLTIALGTLLGSIFGCMPNIASVLLLAVQAATYVVIGALFLSVTSRMIPLFCAAGIFGVTLLWQGYRLKVHRAKVGAEEISRALLAEQRYQGDPAPGRSVQVGAGYGSVNYR